MPIFLAIPLKAEGSALNSAVETTITDAANRYKLPDDRGWLIKFEGTTTELSNFIGITGQSAGVVSAVGAAMVIPISGYFGRGPTDMWEWLKVRLEQ